MASKLIEQIQDVFEGESGLSQEKLETLIHESLKLMFQLQSEMTSSDPKVREEAMEKILSLKEELETEAKRVVEKTGLTPEALTEMAHNSSQFSPREWEALSKARQELEEFKSGLPAAKRETPKNRPQKHLGV